MIKWKKPKKELPPDNEHYRCYIKFMNDGHISLSDGATVCKEYKLKVNGKIRWMSISDMGIYVEQLEKKGK